MTCWQDVLKFELNENINEIVYDINTMSCPIKVNSNTIELTVHTSCYCVLDLLCVNTDFLMLPVCFFSMVQISLGFMVRILSFDDTRKRPKYDTSL